MTKSKIILIIIIIVLLISNIFFGIGYFTVREDLEETKQLVKTQQINERVLTFTSLFIDKVLKSEGEVSFEDRLTLKNAVRALEDEAILNQWQKFVESEAEEQAQREVKDLLKILVNKISY